MSRTYRPRRSQQHQPHRVARRGVRHRRHGQRGAGSRHWQATDSADHVWRNDALRHRYHRATPGPLRLHRISCNRNRWTRDGKTRRQRLPLWRDRRHHNRGLRSPARRRAGADRLSAIARPRHGQFLCDQHGAGAVCGTQTPAPQPAGDVNAHDGRGKPPFWMPRSSIVATARSASSSLKKGPRRWTRRASRFMIPSPMRRCSRDRADASSDKRPMV